MRKVVVLSDNHGYWHDAYDSHIAWADEVWHAGDIGSLQVIEHMQRANAGAEIKCVSGNIDGIPITHMYTAFLFFEVENLKVYIKHIVGRPEKYTSAFKKEMERLQPDIIVCGHSHMLLVAPTGLKPNAIHINPGALGIEGFHLQKTLIRLELNQGKITQLQVVDFGKRSSLG